MNKEGTVGEVSLGNALEAPTGAPTVKWDDSSMQSTYANVVNVTGTREEIVLLFGIHQAWHGGVKEVTVQLQDRVILSPFAAKRLHSLLGQMLRVYEGRFGQLKLEGTGGQNGPGESLSSR